MPEEQKRTKTERGTENVARHFEKEAQYSRQEAHRGRDGAAYL